MKSLTKDEEYMQRALELAARGLYGTAPNPMVGAVIVRDGRIIGEGWHERYGQLHAERNALKNCSGDPRGATMYVTLEPCCHYGKQPPCTEAIIAAGISRVVVASGDPNPLVAGKGLALLRSHGIEVTEHVCEEEALELNEVFFHYIRSGLPFVAMKYAMTMDGKIATSSGASRWITGEEARAHVHTLRRRYRGIMVGVGTVLADDPLLTCRLPQQADARDPIRIICDTNLRTPLHAQVVTTAHRTPTIIATACEEESRRRPYEEAGCRLVTVPCAGGAAGVDGAVGADGAAGASIDLKELMKKLAGGEDRIDSILLEGGAALNWSMLAGGLVSKAYVYIAPKIFGGQSAKTPVGGRGVNLPDTAFMLSASRLSRLGDDFLIESKVMGNVYRHS